MSEVTASLPAVDVVIVAHNGGDLLRQAIDSILASNGVIPRVFVVDNASSDGSIGRLGDVPVCLISLTTNLGYGGAFNVGLTYGESPWLVCANQDILLHPESLRRLIETADEAESRFGALVIAGPRLVSKDGSTVETAHHIPTFKDECRELLFGANRNRSVISQDINEAVPCGWVSAVFLLGHRAVFEKLGGFDPDYFMYVEDLDLFKRLRDLGGTCIWEPRATVEHEGGVNTRVRGSYPGLMYTLTLWNLRRYFEKHDDDARARFHGPAILAAGSAGAAMRALLWLSRALWMRVSSTQPAPPDAVSDGAPSVVLEGQETADAEGLARMFARAALWGGVALITGRLPDRVRRLTGSSQARAGRSRNKGS